MLEIRKIRPIKRLFNGHTEPLKIKITLVNVDIDPTKYKRNRSNSNSKIMLFIGTSSAKNQDKLRLKTIVDQYRFIVSHAILINYN